MNQTQRSGSLGTWDGERVPGGQKVEKGEGNERVGQTQTILETLVARKAPSKTTPWGLSCLVEAG